MSENSILTAFASNVADRMASESNMKGNAKAGFIEVLIPALLPTVIDLIRKCFENKNQLKSFCKSGGNLLQKASLRIQCNEVIREANQRWIGARSEGKRLYNAMMAEIESMQSNDLSDDVYEQIMQEATLGI